LNNTLDNTVMLNSLSVRVYDLNNSIISKWYLNTSKQTIDPSTNFLTMILPSSYPTTTNQTPTQSNVSNFANIKKNTLKFADIVASPSDISLASIILVPTNTEPTTTQYQSVTTNPMTTQYQPINTQYMDIQSTSNNGIQETQKYLSPSTRIFQHNFKGTSNVYVPVIYKNVENFVPLNSLDDYYTPYYHNKK